MTKTDKGGPGVFNDQKSFQKSEDTRRNFLKKFQLLGLGTLLYSIPTVETFAQSGAAPPAPGNKFNMRLPAIYSIKGAPVTLDIQGAGDKAIPMKFSAEGSVRLTAAGRGLANIQVVSLVLTNTEDTPVGKAGAVTARISNAAAGQLELKSGRRLGDPSVSVTLSFANDQKIQTKSKVAGGRVTEQASGQGGLAKETNKCTANGNDLSGLARIAGKSKTFKGALVFGMTPQAG